MVNLMYSFFTIISMCLLKYSYGKPERKHILAFVLYVLQVRLVIRFLDIEQTKHLMTVGDWNWIVTTNVFGWAHTFQYLNIIQDENGW